MLQVTITSACILTFHFILLSLRVIKARRQAKVAFGDGTLEILANAVSSDAKTKSVFFYFFKFLIFLESKDFVSKLRGAPENELYVKLQRTVRAQGNQAEYIPIFLFLLYLVEYKELLDTQVLMTIASLFVIARIFHTEFSLRMGVAGRIIGMSSTFVGLLVLVAYLITDVLPADARLFFDSYRKRL